MFRKLIYVFLMISLQAGSLYAQQGIGMSVFGRAVDKETRKPLIGASVSIRNDEKDIQLGNKTNSKGEFEIESVKRGNYKLKITYIGYDSLTKDITVEPRKNLDLGVLEIRVSSVTTDEVEITAQSPIGEIKEDTVIMNANRFKTEPDANAEDLVKKMPGVQVDQTGIKAQGEDVKKVLVDGKPFFGEDPSLTLKNVPAEIIDKVQIYDKMSDQSEFSGFDDGQTSKTMNLITKASRRKGQFGKISGGYGTNDRYIGSLNYNYFNGAQRISVLGLTNNINQQNFAFMDILDMMGDSRSGGLGGLFRNIGQRFASLNIQPPRPSGGSGGPPGGGGMGNFFVGMQDGLSQTHAFGINYSDEWSERVEITGSYFFNYTKNNNDQYLNRDFLGFSDSTQNFEQNTLSSGKNGNHRFNMKFNWRIDTSNTLKIEPSLTVQSTKTGTDLGSITQMMFNSNSQPISSTNTDYSSEYTGLNFSNETLFKHRFDLKGRTVSFSLNNTYNDKDGSSYLNTINQVKFINSNDTLRQKSNAPNGGSGISGTLIYTEPFGEKHQIQLNYRLSYNTSYSDKKTYNFNDDADEYDLFDARLSNIFDNDYLTHRAGAGYRYKNGDLSGTAMLYYQRAELKSKESSPDTLSTAYTFSNFLPSIRINYKFNLRRNLMFNYRTYTSNPSVSQLQNVLDNSNQLSLYIGNPNLKQSSTHSVMLRMHDMSADFANIFAIWGNVNFTSDYIGNTTIINSGRGPLNVKDALPGFIMDSLILTPGAQFSMPENLAGFLNANAMISYGLPLKFMKSNLNLSTGGFYSKIPSKIYDSQSRQFNINYLNSYNINLIAMISSNISEKVDFSLGHIATLNTTKNSFTSGSNYNYNSFTTSFNIKWMFWKGFFVQSDFKNQYYTGLVDPENNNINMLNFSIGGKFLKNNAAEVKLSVYDALNQNKSFNTSVTSYYVEYQENTILRQYLMLTLTYNLKKFEAGPPKLFGF